MRIESAAVWIGFALLSTIGTAQTPVTTTSGGTTSPFTIPEFNGNNHNIENSPITVSSGGVVSVGSGSSSEVMNINGTLAAGAFGGGIIGTGAISSTSPASTGIGGEFMLYNPTKGTPGTNTAYLWTILNVSSPYSSALEFWDYDNKVCGSGSQMCTPRVTFMDNGYVGIGTTNPGASLEVNGNVKLTSSSGGSVVFQDGTVQSTAYTGVTCGGDYAESVDVAGDRRNYSPGDVLVIDPDSPGKFLKSAEAYSTFVTGIYSTKPGTVGRRQTTPKSPDEVPMAVVGIVPTKVSTENGPIRPGDLLVSSSTIGFAMRGTDRSRMLGAVVGKALGSLDSGTGVIEAVVTLQ